MKSKFGRTVAFLVASTTIFGAPVIAEDKIPEKTIPLISAELPEEKIEELEGEYQEHASDFINARGIIKEIVKDGDQVTLIVEDTEKSLETHFPITKEIPAYSSATTNEFSFEDFKKGQQVEVFYDRNKPIMMIYPSIIVPELIVIHEEEQIANVKVGKFDENWLSLDGELKLNISEETKLLNQANESIAIEDLSDKELLVFYTIATLSLPAQTAPKKIVALEPLYDEQDDIDRLIEEDHYKKNKTKMIPLRKVAELLGNEVIWHQETFSVTVKKQNRTFSISIGDEMYGYNRSIRYFDYAPEVKNGKTYVSEELLELLMD